MVKRNEGARTGIQQRLENLNDDAVLAFGRADTV